MTEPKLLFKINTYEGAKMPLSGHGVIPPERRADLGGLQLPVIGKVEYLGLHPNHVRVDSADIARVLRETGKEDRADWWEGYASGLTPHDEEYGIDQRLVTIHYHAGVITKTALAVEVAE